MVLRNANLAIRRGEFIGVVGPSGSGKTSLLRTLLGQIERFRGEMLLHEHGSGGAVRIGYVPQVETVDWNFPITVEQVVLQGRWREMGRRPWANGRDRNLAREVLERLQIYELRDRPIRALSGGQQQRVFLGRALIGDPDLLLLDEPTSGVDIKTRHEVMHLLGELNHAGTSIVLTTHDLNAVASHLPRLIAIGDRRIVADGVPAEVLNQTVLREAYGAEMLVLRRGNRLYVIPFESNNKTQLSGGKKIDGDLVTFNAHEHSVANNNVLSIGHVTDIVKHPRVPDRDLYVFDTTTDALVETVDTLGTLLYGLAVDSKGTVFVAQTDARNDVNGRAGTKKHGLKEMGNRAFLNQITKVSFEGGKARKPQFMNLEPLPPKHPQPDKALATPFAIQVSRDDSTLLVSAAGSDKIFTVDAETGQVLGRTQVGSVPRGIALQPGTRGKPSQAWVLNAVANTVSVLSLIHI